MQDRPNTYSNYIPFELQKKSVADLLAEFRTSSVTKFERNYHIKFNKDGSVFDRRKKMCYSTLKSWADEALSHKGETDEKSI